MVPLLSSGKEEGMLVGCGAGVCGGVCIGISQESGCVFRSCLWHNCDILVIWFNTL